MSMKNSNDTIGNRTRDLSTCSAVPQPSALPRAPLYFIIQKITCVKLAINTKASFNYDSTYFVSVSLFSFFDKGVKGFCMNP